MWHTAADRRGAHAPLGGTRPYNSPPPTQPVQVSEHTRCRVRITVSAGAGKVPQKGHKVSLTGVMVSHLPIHVRRGEMDAVEERRAVAAAG